METENLDLQKVGSDSLTILLIAENNLQELPFTLESIRLYNDIDNLSVIVIDNNSEDRTAEWAKDQTDITYVGFDDEKKSYGELICETIDALQITGSILIMRADYAITFHTLSRLKKCILSLDDVSVVGGINPNFDTFQLIPKDICTYEQTLEYSNQLKTGDIKRNLEVQGPILIEDVELLSLWDSKIKGCYFSQVDFCVNLSVARKKIYLCNDAIFWRVPNDKKQLKSSLDVETEEDYNYIHTKWNMNYFDLNCNPNLPTLVVGNPQVAINILEIGCDCGATLLEIKNRYPNANIFGTDIMDLPLQIAGGFATVAKNNIEEKNIPFDVKFDYIIFGDVLEHLRNPEEVLAYCKNLLNDDGHIIASIPNIQHISVIEDLLNGNFTYTDVGLLDKTHIHFFTAYEIVKMIKRIGMELELLHFVKTPITVKQQKLIDQLMPLSPGAERGMFEAFQYLVLIKKEN